jgi:adenosine/AMP kinase
MSHNVDSEKKDVAYSGNDEDLEKKDIAYSEDNIESVVRDLANDERITAFTEKQQKAIVRRIDLRLVVTLGCLYCISLLDRTNLGAASVAG